MNQNFDSKPRKFSASSVIRKLSSKEKLVVLLIFAPVTLILLSMLAVVYFTWQTPQLIENKEGAKTKQFDL